MPPRRDAIKGVIFTATPLDDRRFPGVVYIDGEPHHVVAEWCVMQGGRHRGQAYLKFYPAEPTRHA